MPKYIKEMESASNQPIQDGAELDRREQRVVKYKKFIKWMWRFYALGILFVVGLFLMLSFELPSFEELENGKTAIYIVMPAGRITTYNRFLRMLICLAITAATRFKTKPNPPVYFLIEEAPALGRMDVIETAFGLLAGYGFQIHMFLQDLNQLLSLYGERWQTFIANSGVIQIFGTRELLTS